MEGLGRIGRTVELRFSTVEEADEFEERFLSAEKKEPEIKPGDVVVLRGDPLKRKMAVSELVDPQLADCVSFNTIGEIRTDRLPLAVLKIAELAELDGYA